MIIPILISIAVVLGCGAVIWFVLRRGQAVKSKEPAKQTTAGATLAFHWSYIILPVVILLLSIILTAYFYHLLPVKVAWHFEADGLPDEWLGRGTIILWMLLPQLFLTLLAGAITWGITKLGALFRQPESTWIKPDTHSAFVGICPDYHGTRGYYSGHILYPSYAAGLVKTLRSDSSDRRDTSQGQYGKDCLSMPAAWFHFPQQ